jgi:transcriptional regulator with XRE-family HTH domain
MAHDPRRTRDPEGPPHPLKRLLDVCPPRAAAVLAERAGVTRQRISDYATGCRNGHSPVGYRVAAAAGIPLAQWLELEPYEPPGDPPEWARESAPTVGAASA